MQLPEKLPQTYGQTNRNMLYYRGNEQTDQASQTGREEPKPMNILLLSDSHGHTECIREAIQKASPDCILFAGDGLRDMEAVQADLPPHISVYAVKGNCDPIWGDGEEEQLLTLDGVRILLLHGHTKGVKSGLDRAVAYAKTRQADVLVFGHTHEPFEKTYFAETATGERQGLLACNPGSVGRYPRSFGTLTIQNRQALFGVGYV